MFPMVWIIIVTCAAVSVDAASADCEKANTAHNDLSIIAGRCYCSEEYKSKCMEDPNAKETCKTPECAKAAQELVAKCAGEDGAGGGMAKWYKDVLECAIAPEKPATTSGAGIRTILSGLATAFLVVAFALQ
eukprot:gnl/TRDRNA2_/TRDRNA2_84925_c1_seq1.p1 gnl/TRDRNA2_/TRDRNA2_84925_c1~~gnl/TRDRNA2_/TRDRNA2_84925_c1_seq1.p1  ORF type:complete len:132 (-),score=18.22 gnl/TRDRNA2_/TRDRNA2_84925_c1_seq1:42-437(-)